MQQIENPRQRLVKLLGKLGTDNDHERAVVGRFAFEMLRALNLQWEDVIVPVLGEKQSSARPSSSFRAKPAAAERVYEWFDQPEAFKRVLKAAILNVRTANEEGFISSLLDKYKRYGQNMYLSERQHKWLSDIAKR